MAYRLLGPLAIEVGGHDVPLGSRRARLVLATLLLHRDAPVPRETLVDVVWGDRPPQRTDAGLRVVLSRLRQQLEPGRVVGTPSVLTREAAGWRLAVAPGDLDADRFEEHVAASERAAGCRRWDQAASFTRAALAEWRGPALVDVVDDLDLARGPAARWEELRLIAAERAAEAEIELGRPHVAIAELAPMVEAHPYRERSISLLMLALYRSGRQVEALRVFHDARRRLVEQLGNRPTAELDQLERAILAQDADLVGTPVAPPPASDRPAPVRRDAVAPLTALCGQFAELAGAGPEQAAGRAVSEGYQSLAAADHDTAIARFEEARRLLEQAGGAHGRAHVEVLIAIGRARRYAGDRDGSRAGLRVAIDEAREGGLLDLWAEAVLAYAGEMASIDDEDGSTLELLREVHAHLPDDLPVLQVRVATRLAAVLILAEGPAAADTISAEALSRARALGAPHHIAQALHVRLFVLAHEPPATRLPPADEAVRQSVDGDEVTVAVALHDRLLVLFELGLREEVDRALEVFTRQARRSRAPMPWLASSTEAALALSRGDLGRAEALTSQAWEEGWRSGAPDAALAYAIQLVMIRWLQGRLGELLDAVTEQSVRQPGVLGWLAVRALALAERGDLDCARAAIEELLPAVVKRPTSPGWLGGVAFLAEATAVVGPTACSVARRLFDELRPYAGRHLLLGRAGAHLGPCDRYLAGLLAVAGEGSEAITTYRRAAALADGAGLVPYAELARLGAIAAAGRTGDDPCPLDPARAARLARERGLVLIERRAASLTPVATPGLRRGYGGVASLS